MTAALRSLALTATQVLLAVLVLAGLGEILARSDWAQQRLPTPIVDSGHHSLDVKLWRLDRRVREHGPLQCLFIGPSVVDRGIDPELVSQSYREVTGRDLDCFNFGVSGINASSLEVLAAILVERSRPALLVVSMLPGWDGAGAYHERNLRRSQWVDYHSPGFNAAGWLFEHSLLVRYALRLRIWLQEPRLAARLAVTEAGMSAHGYTPFVGAKLDVSRPADRQKEAKGFRSLSGFKLAERHVEALDRLLGLLPPGRVLLVETPLHATFFDFFPRGERDYRDMLDAAARVAGRRGLPFWQTVGLDLVAEWLAAGCVLWLLC